MAISGDLRVSATLASYSKHPPLLCSLPPSNSKVSTPSFNLALLASVFTCILYYSSHVMSIYLCWLGNLRNALGDEMGKIGVEFLGFLNGGCGTSQNMLKWPGGIFYGHKIHGHFKRSAGIAEDYQLSSTAINQEAESLLLSAINMSFLERLNLAWRIIFPSPTQRKSSNARIAKQRLKMILFSDRCAVSDEAKQKIVNNIVHALSEFVEIESQDKVQLSVTTDTDLGTVYSVTVPVRRVKPGYQEEDESGSITNIEYKDSGETSGSVDVQFDFYIPDERPR
ncbi:hypothetical protein DKX38_012657 [Salix brachista]|uniref:Cell division topological specificity factor MinE n=1 Tax=Salix brachista TaxID=2182728 RepID=A0A5N5LP21_9ROSI|nr:hypothetical protein DKX38_012657 [Salix brachista]